MNKLKLTLLGLATAACGMFACPFSANAADLWGRQKTFKVGLAFNTMHIKPVQSGFNKYDYDLTPNYGFMMGLTKTYLVHKQPIAGFLRFGIEATWLDVTYTNYASTLMMPGNNNSGWNDPDPGYDPDYGYDYDYDDEELSLGNHQVDLGMGVGVSATFVPFSKMSPALAALKGKLYCNFMPSASILLQSEGDGNNNVSAAFVPYVTFGAQFSWKLLSLFVEGRWGGANYNMLISDSTFEDEDGYDDSSESGTEKIGGHNAAVRVGIGLSF